MERTLEPFVACELVGTPRGQTSERIPEPIVDPGLGVVPREQNPESLPEQTELVGISQERNSERTFPVHGPCVSAPSSSAAWRPERHPSWRQAADRDGRVYYWNVYTRRSQWELPLEIPEELEEKEEVAEAPSRFRGSFRPRQYCLNFLDGCRWGSACTFAHAQHELHPDVQGLMHHRS